MSIRNALLAVLIAVMAGALGAQSVTVSAPNGGENLTVGANTNITWVNGGGFTGNVDIDMSTTGGPPYTINIATDIANTGTFAWVVPNNVGLQTRIRVQANAGGTPTDESDADFTINPAGGIVVTFPNGGENLAVGANTNITWNTTGGFSDLVNIDLSTNGGASFAVSVATNVASGTGTFAWTVPANVGTQMRIRIQHTATPFPTDASDANFTINPAGSIAVTAPNGAENLTVGNNFNITWNNGGGFTSTVDIDLSVNSGGAYTVVVASNIANTGSFNWTVSNNPAATCRIRVRNNSTGLPVDESDADFTIAAATPTITVTAPNGGESLFEGNSFNITWTNGGGFTGNVNIALSTNSGGTFPISITTNLANTGSFNWTVTDLLATSTTCRVRVRDTATGTILDDSDADFTINDVTFTVTAPNGGENLTVGANPNITWTTTAGFTANVDIDLSLNSGASYTISVAANIANSGTFGWTVPNNPGTTCRIRVRATVASTLSDESNADFTITAANAPPVLGAITWPTVSIGGADPTFSATVTVGQNLNITFPSTDADTGDTLTFTVTRTAGSIADPATAGFTGFTGQVFNDPAPGTTPHSVTLAGSAATAGTITLQVVVNDGTVPDIYDFVITISAGNVAPVLNAPTWPGQVVGGSDPAFSATVGQGESLAISFPATDANAGDTLTTTITVTGGSLTPAQAGLVGFVGGTFNDPLPGTSPHSVALSGTSSTPGDIQLTVLVSDGSLADQYTFTLNILLSSTTVTRPNGSESLAIGTPVDITWNTAQFSANIDIDLSLDSGASYTINVATNVSSVSPFVWTVPNNPSTTCRIRIRSTAGGFASDESNSDFTITTIQPSVTVTSPNGGEVLTAGTVFPITFNRSVSFFGTIDIHLSTDSGATFPIVVVTGAGAQTFNWTVPGNISTTCRIRIRGVNAPNPFDVSDADFTIQASPTPSVTVTSPNGGEVLTVAGAANITWTNGGGFSGNVDIELSTDGGTSFPFNVATNAPGTGTFSWTVPNNPSALCRIRVRATGSGSPQDTSNANFTIQLGASPAIGVTAPNGGQTLLIGSNFNITWTNGGGFTGNVDIALSTDGGGSFPVTVATNIANTGTFSWTIPNNPSIQCRVRVQANAGGTPTDTSNANFTIAVPTPFTVTLTSPNGGETRVIGSGALITWTNGGGFTGNVDILLSTDGGASYPTTIVGNTPNGLFFNWTVPNLPTTTARIRIRATGTGTPTDDSDGNFTIVAGTLGGAIGDAGGTSGSRVVTPGQSVDGLHFHVANDAQSPGPFTITAVRITINTNDNASNLAISHIAGVRLQRSNGVTIDSVVNGGTGWGAAGAVVTINFGATTPLNESVPAGGARDFYVELFFTSVAVTGIPDPAYACRIDNAGGNALNGGGTANYPGAVAGGSITLSGSIPGDEFGEDDNGDCTASADGRSLALMLAAAAALAVLGRAARRRRV